MVASIPSLMRVCHRCEYLSQHQFHQYQVGKTFLAHITPCFAINHDFVLHYLTGKAAFFIIQSFAPCAGISSGGAAITAIVSNHNTIVDHRHKFTRQYLPYPLRTFSWMVRIRLCCKCENICGLRLKWPTFYARVPVVNGFLIKKIFLHCYVLPRVVLLVCSHHD